MFGKHSAKALHPPRCRTDVAVAVFWQAKHNAFGGVLCSQLRDAGGIGGALHVCQRLQGTRHSAAGVANCEADARLSVVNCQYAHHFRRQLIRACAKPAMGCA